MEIAEDRASTVPRVLNLGVPCTALEMTPSDLALCLGTKNKLLVFRGSEYLQAIDATGFATSGNVVWTSIDGGISRWTDVGGSVPLGAPIDFDTGLIDDRATLVTTSNEALLMTAQGFVEVRVDAGVVARSSNKVEGALIQPRGNLDTLLVFYDSPPRTCLLRVSDAATAVNCLGAGDTRPLGADRTGLWLRDARGGLVHDGFAADGGFDRTRISMSELAVPTELPRHFESTPVMLVGSTRLVPRFDAGSISLEAYAPGPQFTLTFSSASVVRAQGLDGTQELFAR